MVEGAVGRVFARSEAATRVGCHLRLHLDADTTVPALVESVSAGPGDGPTVEQFSVVLRTAPDVPPVQRTYTVDDEVLGRVELFLVPIAADADGLRFEAVVCRLTTAQSG